MVVPSLNKPSISSPFTLYASSLLDTALYISFLCNRTLDTNPRMKKTTDWKEEIRVKSGAVPHCPYILAWAPIFASVRQRVKGQIYFGLAQYLCLYVC